MRSKSLKKVLCVAGAAAALGSASSAFAWGWWWVAAEAVGVAVICVSTGGAGAVALAVGSGLAVGTVGEAAIGDSVYDDIVASPTNPAPLIDIHNPPTLPPIILPPIANSGMPTAIVDELNTARQLLADSLQLSRGVRESCRRFYGASLVGDTSAMEFQAQNALQFVQAHEAALELGLQHFSQYSAMMRPLVPHTLDFMTTASEYQQFVNQVRAQNALPSCMETELGQLQLTSTEIQNIRIHTASKTSAEINAFFAPFGPQGAFVPDLWDEMVRQFQYQRMRDAIPGEIKAWWNNRCVADVDDGSFTGTIDGGVTIDDLLYYLYLFEQGDIRADVDDGSGTGTHDGGVTIDDLLYYLFRFEAGC